MKVGSETSEWLPALAPAWEANEDATAWTFTLIIGVNLLAGALAKALGLDRGGRTAG